MPRLRRLSGDEVIRILHGLGFTVRSQRGSHVKLHRRAPDGTLQVLTVPRHRELATGTLHDIFRQAAEFIPEEELRSYFYTG